MTHDVSEHTRTRNGRTETVRKHSRADGEKTGGNTWSHAGHYRDFPDDGPDDGSPADAPLCDHDQARRDRFEVRVLKERQAQRRGKTTGRTGRAHGEKAQRKKPSTHHAKQHAKKAVSLAKMKKKKGRAGRRAQAAVHLSLSAGFLAWHVTKAAGRGARVAGRGLRKLGGAFRRARGFTTQRLRGEWS